jgi:hypothetical protein
MSNKRRSFALNLPSSKRLRHSYDQGIEIISSDEKINPRRKSSSPSHPHPDVKHLKEEIRWLRSLVLKLIENTGSSSNQVIQTIPSSGLSEVPTSLPEDSLSSSNVATISENPVSFPEDPFSSLGIVSNNTDVPEDPYSFSVNIPSVNIPSVNIPESSVEAFFLENSENI